MEKQYKLKMKDVIVVGKFHISMNMNHFWGMPTNTPDSKMYFWRSCRVGFGDVDPVVEFGPALG